MGDAGLAYAQSAPSPYLTGYRYLDGGLLAGTISPAPSGTSGFIATRNTYDSNGRLAEVETGTLSAWEADTILPANWTGFTVTRIEVFAYDAEGRKIQDTFEDQNGAAQHVTQYAYDAFDRLTCTTVRMNTAVFASLPSDACSLGAQGTNGPDRITVNIYDNLNRLIQVRRAVGTAQEQAYATYSYTPDGLQQDIVDANGNHTLLAYDGLDREAQMTLPSKTAVSGFDPGVLPQSPATAPEKDMAVAPATALATAGAVDATDYEAYGYDANGNRTSLRKRDGTTISYQYDNLNRMTVKTPPTGDATYYDYDNRGLVLDAKFASLSGVGLSYAYDFAGRRVTETSYGEAINYQYDNDGDRTRLTWPDGYYVAYSYDGMDRMSSASQNGSATLASFTYDQIGRLASTQYGAGSPAATVSNSWGPWDDLLTMSHSLSDTNSVSFTDGYSAGHQILQSSISNTAYQYAASSMGSTAYVPNGLNQYASITPPGSSAVTPTYDANGNLTNDGKFSYTYDAENRLTDASETGMSAVYLYDPEGRRREKQVTGGSYAGTTQFLDAGDDEIADYDGSGTLLQRFIPGRAVDEPIAMVTAAGTITYFHRDKTDSVVAMSDTSGKLALLNGPSSPADGPYTYDAYGNCMVGGVACAGGVPFKYTGQRFDPETGLYYYRARFYDPLLGRFLQTDPIGYKDDIDWYDYVGDDPTDKNDPSGEAQCADPNCDTAFISHDIMVSGVPFESSMAGSPNKTYVTISFENDTPGGPSTDHAIQTQTAVMLEEAVVAAGVSSININSTTGGIHDSPQSAHYQGRAVDINRVNGAPVSSSNLSATDLQESLAAQPEIRENFGPSRMEKTAMPGGRAQTVTSSKLRREHRGHIHAAGQPETHRTCAVGSSGNTACH